MPYIIHLQYNSYMLSSYLLKIILCSSATVKIFRILKKKKKNLYCSGKNFDSAPSTEDSEGTALDGLLLHHDMEM